MTSYSSATVREQAPHLTNISNALKRRTQSVIEDKSIDAQTRALVRYALETNDPWLPELVRRIDGGETVGDDFFVSTPEPFADQSSEEKIGTMSRLICRAGDEAETKAAALLILMSMIENSNHPKTLANEVKHFAFARCGELNLCGMVDVQTGIVEGELFAGNSLAF